MLVIVVLGMAMLTRTISAASVECSGVPNHFPIADSPPVHVRDVANGKLYMAEGEHVNPSIKTVHVYGSPYEMGKAYGELLGEDIANLIHESLKWVEGLAPNILPKPIQNQIIEKGVKATLDWTWDHTKNYTPYWFKDEMQGVADGAGLDVQNVIRANMIPELVQAACSMFGAWGQAIKNTDGTLVQLRALDWNVDGPFQKYPVVTVYHPDSQTGAQPGGHAFANVAWAGFIGSLTGFSSQPMGICEKVWIHYNGTKPRTGVPWNFLLRDVLQFDQDIDQALQRIANAERTCSIFVGLGDGESNTFRAVPYSHDYIEIWNDKNFPAYDNHPIMDDLVWLDKHTQPSTGDPCMTQLLEYYYGSITPEITIQNITAQFETGNTMAAIYDYARNKIYVSNAGIYGEVPEFELPAYNRQFTAFDMTALFNEEKPVFASHHSEKNA